MIFLEGATDHSDGHIDRWKRCPKAQRRCFIVEEVYLGDDIAAKGSKLMYKEAVINM